MRYPQPSLKIGVGISNDKTTILEIGAMIALPFEGGVRVCGDAVLRYFWCGFAVIFILTRGIAVSKH